MARGFAALDSVELTVVVNVGDDDTVYGLPVSPDIDTVCYTLAGLEGPEGWGRSGEVWTVMGELARFGIDTTFRLGDLDLAVNLFRADRAAKGHTLSETTAAVCAALGVTAVVVPASDDPLRTLVEVPDGWIDFQTYFVRRRHVDPVRGVRYVGADSARPAPGVVEAIAASDLVVVAPSNPVLSVAPILAVADIRRAVTARRVVAVSPLIGGKAVKGPAVEAMAAVGLPPTNAGVLAAYGGIVERMVVDDADADEALGVETLATDIRIPTPLASRRLAEEIVAWLG